MHMLMRQGLIIKVDNMGLFKTLTTINGNSLGGLIIKLIYKVPKMSDEAIIDIVTGRKWAPEYIKI